jgi:hypothetical protein
MFCILLSGCTDFKIELPNGYILFRANATEIYIIDPNRLVDRIVVEPHIEKYNVIDKVVVGYAVLAKGEMKEYSIPGYFILETETGTVTQGLSKDAWVKKLKELGINSEPKLKAPTIFSFDVRPT